MTHLSQQQIQMMADKTLEAREHDALQRHALTCSRCSKELAFQHSLLRAARQAPLVRPSGGFTSRVMELVAPELKGGLAFRFLGNFARALAMVSVVGVIGYVLTMNLPSAVSAQSTQPSELSQAISQSYASFQKFLATQSNQMTNTVAEKTSVKGSKVGLMALVSLLILALLDRLFFRQHGRMRVKS